MFPMSTLESRTLRGQGLRESFFIPAHVTFIFEYFSQQYD